MRAKIKVTDLNLRQWDYLTTEVPVDGRTFLPGLPRACVEFELTPDFTSLHIEMDVAEFTGLTCVLESIKNETIAVAQAALTPDALPDRPCCDHGAAVVRETPSLFAGAQPVRNYADGCQSYGPYQHDEDDENTRPAGSDQ